MTPKQADQIIKDGRTHTFHNTFTGSTFPGTATKRDRWNIWITYMWKGNPTEGKFDRGDLEVKGLAPDRNVRIV